VSSDKDTANDVINSVLQQVASLEERTRNRSLRIRWGETRLPISRTRKNLRDWVEAQLFDVICAATPFGEAGFTVGGVSALEQGVGLKRRQLSTDDLLRRARLLSAADLRLVDRETDVAVGTSVSSRPEQSVRALERDLAADVELSRRLGHLEAFVEACRNDATYRGLGAVELLLMAEPPSYVDVMLRWLRAEKPLSGLLQVVNALRGTQYPSLPMVEHDDLLAVEPEAFDIFNGEERPRIVLGNLCTEESWWTASLTAPVLTMERQQRLAGVLNKAVRAAERKPQGRPTLLVLPELSLPRRWIREVLRHLSYIGTPVSFVAGLEYDVVHRSAYNEVIAFLPRPFFLAAAWIWTKRRAAHYEGRDLAKAGFSFATRAESRRFVVISSEHGRFIPLICSELLEADTRSRLLGNVDLVLVPSWNRDTTSFEYFVQSSPIELHSFIAVANNGIFSDCRTRGPYAEGWRREVCRLISRNENEIVVADLPIDRLREYRADPVAYDRKRKEWIASSGENESACPWPAWKPAPPGMAE
jgi:predicted amidohydrolase